MITIENLSKNFGAQKLFDNINIKINSREHVGLVGRNGHGKTTLLRMIIGEEHPDSGLIIIPRYYKIGYVKQQLEFIEDTVLKECMRKLSGHEKDHYWKAEKILSGLGFSNEDMQRHPAEFSGGYQVRLNLAKEFVSEPNMLLLDEPTNYLDILSIRWTERFLLNWSGELILISHDRSFMDKLVTHIIGIHRKKIRKITGNTEKFYSLIARDEEIYERTRINDERKRKEIEQFINRFRAKARLANLVQSRIKTLEKKEKRERLENIDNLDFYFTYSQFEAKQVMSVNDLSFSYNPGKEIISNFNLTVGANDRICIVGKNGKGKTTLLKLLAGILKPDCGKINLHPNIKIGFYEQGDVQSLADKRTVEEEILNSQPGMDRQHVRNICGAMMFEGDDALKKVEILSGGEKSRVMLGKIIARPVNLLLLDEPTNHLDMESCDAMLSAIDNYKGAVIIVTHNEMFLHALAERLIVFQNDISVYEGTYQDFLEQKGWEDEEEDARIGIAIDNDKYTKINKKNIRRLRSGIIKERSQVLKPIENRIIELEKGIEEMELELSQLNVSMIKASQEQNGEKISEISQSIHKCKSVVDILFEELERLTTEYENKNDSFEKRLSQLETTAVIKGK